MSKARDEFLTHVWSRYPETPARALRWGRVQQQYLGAQSLAEFQIVNQENVPLNLSAMSILVDGDLIAILPQNQLVLLAPNLLSKPLPEAWSQQKNWGLFLAGVRKIFVEKSFLEVKTPTLVDCPGTEPSLDFFTTKLELGERSREYYLPTSPELNMKKLLSRGAEKIFEISSVFRNGESTERHAPEFLMLEWYRSFSNLSKIKMDVVELVETSCDILKVAKPTSVITYSIPELFKQYCQFEIKPNTSKEELDSLALKLGVDTRSATSIDDVFYLIFMEKIENKWPADHLIFVEKYPPYQAALARIGKDGWAERFEFYWRGLELGNAFNELNDPELQLLRAKEDNEKKVAMKKAPVQLDEYFFQNLRYGMPPSAGIAVGLERLYMAMTGIRDISALSSIYRI